MISYNSKYIGSAIVSMIDSCHDGLYIKRIVDDKSGFYLINNKLPILCKYSTKRTNPWSFSFKSDVLGIYLSLKQRYNVCLIILVCGIDGILALDSFQVQEIIDLKKPSDQKRISVTRKLRKMYYISGSDGTMKNKISQSSVIDILKKYIEIGDVNT
jgi:hypothetical protein